MYTLYSMQRSGNSYKVRLALARLGVPYNLVEVDVLKGESRTPEFLAINPNGQVPLLEVAPYRYLAESMRHWHNQRTLAELIAKAGWRDVEWLNLTFGVVALHRATKPLTTPVPKPEPS